MRAFHTFAAVANVLAPLIGCLSFPGRAGSARRADRLHRTSSILSLVLLIAGGAAGSGCASTKIVDTWRDPAQTGPLDFQRVLVFALAPDEHSRNVSEDTIVERIGPDRAVAGHDIFSDVERSDPRKVKSELAKGNFDGVITIGIVGTRRMVSRDAAQGADEPFYGYYDRAGAFAAQDYPEESDTVYRIETRIF